MSIENKNSIYACRYCGPGAVEFEMHNIFDVDEYGRNINFRQYRQVLCHQCKREAVVVKKSGDIPTAKEAAIEVGQNTIQNNLINEVVDESEYKKNNNNKNIRHI